MLQDFILIVVNAESQNFRVNFAIAFTVLGDIMQLNNAFYSAIENCSTKASLLREIV